MNNNKQILSMNVRGLFSNTKKRSDVFNWVKAKKIFFQILKRGQMYLIGSRQRKYP